MEYSYLGNQVYEAKLSLYVSCPYPDMTPYIGCKVGVDTISGDSLVFVQETDITGIPTSCPVQTKCSGDTSAVYGVMRLSWSRKFDLDTASHCDVLFFAYAAKREAGITTGSAGQHFYIDSWLNQCTAPGSSSPTMAGMNENGYMLYNRDQALHYGIGSNGDFDSVSYAMSGGRTAAGTQIYYSFGDTGNYVIPENSGLAEALVVTDKACLSVFPIEIEVNELPDPDFSYSTLTERNLLFIPAHQWNAYYSWDFGDTTTSSQTIVNHSFNANGPHEVSLIVTDRSSPFSTSCTYASYISFGTRSRSD